MTSECRLVIFQLRTNESIGMLTEGLICLRNPVKLVRNCFYSTNLVDSLMHFSNTPNKDE